MSSVAKLCVEQGINVPLYKIQSDDDEMFSIYPVKQLKSYDTSGGFSLSEGLLGATAWGLASLVKDVDYLFVSLRQPSATF